MSSTETLWNEISNLLTALNQSTSCYANFVCVFNVPLACRVYHLSRSNDSTNSTSMRGHFGFSILPKDTLAWAGTQTTNLLLVLLILGLSID